MKKLLIALTASALFAFSASAQELDMVDIPGKDFKMLKTEVTQELYEEVMGVNPSRFQPGRELFGKEYKITAGENIKRLPVENVSWFDAIYFCNKLSEKKGLTPVYAVDGETDVSKWNYTSHNGMSIDGDVTQNISVNGYRLPTLDEWQYAVKGGMYFKYSGSDSLDNVGWYLKNSNNQTHEVRKKKPNGYGLYDMNGNVNEWIWDAQNTERRYCGGSFDNQDYSCVVNFKSECAPDSQYSTIGFRIVCFSVSESSVGELLNVAQYLDMEEIPEKRIKILRTEVNQKFYKEIMGENPSFFQSGSEKYKDENKKNYEISAGENPDKLPVESVSWYDAIYFCNKLSEREGLTPVYAVDGETDVSKWIYKPHTGNAIKAKITQDTSVNGFRLPTSGEWRYAAKGGQNYEYSGDDYIDSVSWNQGVMTHSVAMKKANGYGLYDMSGNVWEWVWDEFWMEEGFRYVCGGSYRYNDNCKVDSIYDRNASCQYNFIGFRIVCAAD